MIAIKLGVNPNIVDTATNLASNYLNKPVEGQGFVKGTKEAKKHAQLMRGQQSNKKHFVKGSQEAKDHMAQLRSMRKTGKGFNFLKGIKKIAGNKTVQGIAGTVIKKGIAMSPIGNLVPTSVTDGLIDQAVSTGGDKIAGSGLQPKTRLTSNVYSPIIAGVSPIKRTIVRGGSFLELGR
jgi:hypothetical protein